MVLNNFTQSQKISHTATALARSCIEVSQLNLQPSALLTLSQGRGERMRPSGWIN